MNQNKKIIIVGNFLFPSGSAPSMRVRNMANGFIQNGYDVHIISISPSNSSRYKVGKMYQEHGYTFEFTADLNKINNSAISKILYFFKFYLASKSMFRRFELYMKLNSVALVLGYGRNYMMMNMIFSSCKSAGVPTVLDICEKYDYSKRLLNLFNPLKLDQIRGMKLLPQRATLLTLITSSLNNYYTNINTNRLIIPGIETWEDVKPEVKFKSHEKRIITYVGSLIERDNPKQLIEFLRFISKHNYNITLNIVGRYRYNKGAQKYLRILETEDCFNSLVKFYDSPSEGDMHKIFADSDAFLLTRRNHSEEIYSFPTRLIEFLKTAKPVIISNIGDIGMYLSNRSNCLMLNENTLDDDFSTAIKALYIPELYKQIGNSGWLVGKTKFNSVIEMNKVLNKIDGIGDIR